MKGIISVDGGGTKSEILIVLSDGKVIYKDIVASSNPNDIGMENAFNNLNLGLKRALSFSVINNTEIMAIFLGIAGIEFGDSINVLKDKLIKSLDFPSLYVNGDLASVVELGLGNLNSGVVVISGTGFNMAIKDNEKLINIGGWGYLADDYLSGYDLGKDALKYASFAINKVGKDTILVDLFNKELGNTLWYSMADIYKGGITKVASFSKLVMEGYRKNDEVCLQIVNSRVDHLSNVIKNNTISMKEKNVVLFGGVFENNKEIVDRLKANLSNEYKITITNKKTVYGATLVALKKANISVTKEIEDNFIKSYKEEK
jgi:N-acetylglucosamine kinase-like BadF-type ATPase